MVYTWCIPTIYLVGVPDDVYYRLYHVSRFGNFIERLAICVIRQLLAPSDSRDSRFDQPCTEQHAPRGTAGRGHNWDRGPGPCAGHAGAARRCTKRHCRLWAQPGPWAVHGPRELRVDTCTSRHRRPRDHFGIAGCERARAGGAARLGGADLRVYACLSRHHAFCYRPGFLRFIVPAIFCFL